MEGEAPHVVALVPEVVWCGAMQDSIRFFFGSNKQSYGLADILPQRFGPADLLSDPNTPLLLQPQHNSIELTAGTSHSIHCRPRKALCCL